MKNWLSREDLQLTKTFTNVEKEKCKTANGLFSLLCQKFQPHPHRIAMSLCYCKLKGKSHESIQGVDWQVANKDSRL